MMQVLGRLDKFIEFDEFFNAKTRGREEAQKSPFFEKPLVIDYELGAPSRIFCALCV